MDSGWLPKIFFRLIQKLEAKGQVGPDLTFHGLRHFRATRLREAGFDKQTIADFRQETTSMAGYYSRDADLRGQRRGRQFAAPEECASWRSSSVG
jgi:integrase